MPKNRIFYLNLPVLRKPITHIAERILACEMLKNHQCVFAFANDAIAIDESLSRVVYKVDRLALYVPT